MIEIQNFRKIRCFLKHRTGVFLNFAVLLFFHVVSAAPFFVNGVYAQSNNRFIIQEARVRFVSDASLERIEAVSDELRGIIDVTNKTFAFSIVNTSFKGFNSPLQEEHFNENYMESDKYPKCTFSGKVIDEVDFTGKGTYTIRAKGILNVKGIGQERIIKSTIVINDNDILLTSDFNILLSDHEIRIPRIVQQKIAPEINIFVKARMIKGTAGK